MQSSTADPIPTHRPVLLQETLAALSPSNGGRYVDATLGAGGHAEGILEASSPDGCLLGMDVDPQALEIAATRLEKFGNRVRIVHRSYTFLLEEARVSGWDTVDAVVFDLGVSSMQLDTPKRGFSFKTEGPLDMRFDPDNPVNADILVNSLPEEELADIIWRYGEERDSHRIARAICASRPINTTQELASVIRKAVKRRTGRIDPSTRTFQAIRIAVNGELQAVDQVLPLTLSILKPGGRLAVISFHSLEDRLVKQFMRREGRDCICQPGRPVCICGHRASLNELTHRPVTATTEEVNRNPRSRSARLRAAEKVALA